MFIVTKVKEISEASASVGLLLATAVLEVSLGETFSVHFAHLKFIANFTEHCLVLSIAILCCFNDTVFRLHTLQF